MINNYIIPYARDIWVLSLVVFSVIVVDVVVLVMVDMIKKKKQKKIKHTYIHLRTFIRQ